MKLPFAITALILLTLLACASEAPAPAPAPEPVVVAPPAPPAPVPAPAAAAVPPAPAAPAAPAKKKGGSSLGLPSLKVLKEEVGFDKQQGKQAKELYEQYQARLEEAAEKLKSGTDKKAAKKDAEALRVEVLAKARAFCTEAQKAKFDEVSVPKKKAQK